VRGLDHHCCKLTQIFKRPKMAAQSLHIVDDHITYILKLLYLLAPIVCEFSYRYFLYIIILIHYLCNT